MNRRGFLGTLTALAGLALAKIKAPAKPLVKVAYNGQTLGWIQAPTSDAFLFFTENHVWVMDANGVYKKWQPTPMQKHLLGYKLKP